MVKVLVLTNMFGRTDAVFIIVASLLIFAVCVGGYIGISSAFSNFYHSALSVSSSTLTSTLIGSDNCCGGNLRLVMLTSLGCEIVRLSSSFSVQHSAPLSVVVEGGITFGSVMSNLEDCYSCGNY